MGHLEVVVVDQEVDLLTTFCKILTLLTLSTKANTGMVVLI